MQNFHNVNLPSFIAVYASGGPVFETISAITSSGRESRIQSRNIALQEYMISDCRLSLEQFEEFNSFFRARHGQQYSFRMRDYADSILKNEIIAIGDGIEKSFEVYKYYQDKISPYKRRITKLSPEFTSINLRGDVDYNNGIITLESPLNLGENLIMNSLFDVPVRFLNDSFRYNFNLDGSVTINDLKLIEVI